MRHSKPIWKLQNPSPLESGISLKSIVFPRNQYAPEHLEVCRRLDLSAFRGNPDNFAYKPRKDAEITLAVRGLRLADAGVLRRRRARVSNFIQMALLSPIIRASRFLRPFMTRAQSFSEMHLVRINERDARRGSARRGLSFVGGILTTWGATCAETWHSSTPCCTEFRELQDSHGFRSVSMSDLSFEISQNPRTTRLESQEKYHVCLHFDIWAVGNAWRVQRQHGLPRVSMLALVALPLVLFMGTRLETGCDFSGYLHRFELLYNDATFFNVIRREEPGFHLLNWLVMELDLGYMWVNILASSIYVYCIFKFSKLSARPILLIALFFPNSDRAIGDVWIAASSGDRLFDARTC